MTLLRAFVKVKKSSHKKILWKTYRIILTSHKIVKYSMNDLLADFSLMEFAILFSEQRACYSVCAKSQRFQTRQISLYLLLGRCSLMQLLTVPENAPELMTEAHPSYSKK